MMAIQMMIKSTFGLLLGMNAGAIVGGLLGYMLVGPIGVVSGMILGAMVGSLLGVAAGFLKSLQVPQAALQRQAIGRNAMARHEHYRVPAGGD